MLVATSPYSSHITRFTPDVSQAAAGPSVSNCITLAYTLAAGLTMEFLRKLFGRLPQPSPASPSARHDKPQLDTDLDDIITGWRYCATLQSRTPLAILRQHNRRVPAVGGPPTLSREMWHGIWTPEVDEMYDLLGDGATMASEIGPIPQDGGDYLPYLVALRTISEGSLSLLEKEEALRDLVKSAGPLGTPFSKYTKQGELVDQVLPRSLNLLPVSKNVRHELLAMGLKTLESVKATSDQQLLEVKGLGPKSVVAIRQFLSTASFNLKAERYLAEEFKAPDLASDN